MRSIKQVLFATATIIAFSLVAFAQANKLQDLVNARAGQAEGDLESRGYVVTNVDREGDNIYGYWWNQSAKKCVTVRTENGRYASITDTEPFDCNQKANSGMSTGAKTAVGVGAAAAIIGAIALTHKAHHHEDNKHFDDVNREAEYERGYRDGLYNNSYHNYSNSKDYSEGYGVGVAHRGRNLSYSSGRGGYRPHVNVSDLVGSNGSSGQNELERRGFRNVDGFKSGSTAYTIWWNGRSQQCLQVAAADGLFDSIVAIEHPKCR